MYDVTRHITPKVALLDVETDGLEYTKIHCIAIKLLGEKTQLFTDVDKFSKWCNNNTDSNTLWVGHNICGFDWWVINELTPVDIPQFMVYDTSVMSKLTDYRKFFTHSLKELGEWAGEHKGDYDGGWDEYTADMGAYCVQDVDTLEAIYLNQKNEQWGTDYANVEHQMAFICAQMQKDGFQFNKPKAQKLLDDVTKEMKELEDIMSDEWPAELVEDRRIQWREKADGTPYATCIKAMSDAPKWKRDGDELILYKYKDFNPGSPRDRIDKLWDAGWEPFDKTDGYKKYERSKRW